MLAKEHRRAFTVLFYFRFILRRSPARPGCRTEEPTFTKSEFNERHGFKYQEVSHKIRFIAEPSGFNSRCKGAMNRG